MSLMSKVKILKVLCEFEDCDNNVLGECVSEEELYLVVSYIENYYCVMKCKFYFGD